MNPDGVKLRADRQPWRRARAGATDRLLGRRRWSMLLHWPFEVVDVELALQWRLALQSVCPLARRQQDH